MMIKKRKTTSQALETIKSGSSFRNRSMRKTDTKEGFTGKSKAQKLYNFFDPTC